MRRSRLPALLLSAGLLVGLAGCRTGRPDYTINVPPNVLDVRPPRSVLFVETPLRLDAIDQAFARAMPPGGAGGTRLGMFEVRWQLQRQPPTVVVAPPGLVLRVPVTGSLSIGAGFVGCQSRGVGGVFTIGLRPTLDPGGGLVLHDAQVRVEPVGTLLCGGAQLPVPVAELFSLMLKPIEQGLGAALRELRLPLGPAVERGLAELAVPRAMDMEGRRLCLDLDPAGLVVAPIAAAAPALQVGLDVAPRLSLGDCPQKPPAAPRELVVREAAAGGPSRVTVAVAVPATELQAPLVAALVGKHFGSGSSAVLVNSAALGDANGRALIRLGVTGAYNGDLFLWGTPQVRAEGGRYILSVPDLQLASESTSRIQDLRLNLYQMFEGDLATKLRPQVTLDVTDRLNQVRSRLGGTLQVSGKTWQQGLGGAAGLLGIGSLGVRSQVSELVPLAVESRPGLLVAYLQLVGTLQVDIR